MKKGIIIVNGFYTNASIRHQVSTITEEFNKLDVAMEVVKSDSLFCHIEGGECKTKLNGDFVVYLDKDVHSARALEKCGVRLFNSAKAIELCDDKMLTYLTLANSGIAMPKTVSSPVMYREAEDSGFINRLEEVLAYPIVVKEVFGSMGYGVHLATNRGELTRLRERFKLVPHLYQQFVGKGGEDKRVILIGGEVVACMKRTNENDFRSNIEHGGNGSVTTLTDRESQMAKKVAKILNLDYCGVDILTDNDGNPCFCEANSNAFFRGIQNVTGVNVAKAYAEYIFTKLYV